MRRFVRWGWHPVRVAPTAYAAGWLVGTGLLMLPISTQPGRTTGWWEASFTSMSALCITGLAIVDTPTHWSFFGQAVILLLIQVGGFGIMTLSTLIMVQLVGGRATLSQSLMAIGETKARSFGDLRGLPLRILATMLVAEACVATWLVVRFRMYTGSWGEAAWQGLFHAVSAFNNAGFSLYSTNLIGFNADPWIMIPICAAVVLGGLGFPIYIELFPRGGRRVRGSAAGRTVTTASVSELLLGAETPRRRLSVHARLTVTGTLLLLALGYATFVAWEWTNPGTLGRTDVTGRLLGALGGAVFPRTAGFNSIDYAAATPQTIFVNYLLMFIGGGSAGTAGGVKITTVFVLLAAAWGELRGETRTTLAGRAVSVPAQRQAFTVMVLALVVVAAGVVVLLGTSGAPLPQAIFEVVSAFGTVGLSMNLTPTLPPAAWATLMALMYLGRVGVLSVVTALTLQQRHRHYAYPEEDPLVG